MGEEEKAGQVKWADRSRFGLDSFSASGSTGWNGSPRRAVGLYITEDIESYRSGGNIK